ncbi:hypothetical protein GCM10023084_41980 [Streptomyces lacrimifluminis]|uniref:Uncharacterized protein n=1 Tax=Streptomyces lacrimifluminis TaxID=1500077 RepID=A0A917KH61_9ACTN|nr:hypothetical protein [Streptomyces lacrimifluminis]GGJ11223.1 hypothetical protein GCM10012282_04570 [Streptomyces lacrimifluminis]
MLATVCVETRAPDRAGLFEEFTDQGLDKTKAFEIRRQLLATETSFFTSSLSQELREKGEVRGEVRRATTNLLELLEGRGIPVSDAEREQITSCDDLDTLGRWFRRAITAASTAEVFA